MAQSLHIHLSNDAHRGAGYGILALSGCAGQVNSFIIQRSSDARYLAPAGWQESSYNLQPDASDNDSGVVRFALGPAVIDNLDSLENYRLILPETGQKGSLTMDTLIHSSMGNRQGMAASFVPPAPAPKPAPQPEPQPEPEPQPQATEPAPMPELTMPEAPAPTSSPWGKIILIVLLLAALAAGGWWLYQRFMQSPPPPPVAQEEKKDTAKADKPAEADKAKEDAKTKPNNAAKQDKPSEAAKPDAKGAEKAAPQQGGGAAGSAGSAPAALESARTHLRDHATEVEKTMELAQAMRKADAKANADPAFLLLEDAAQRGKADAMQLVGRYYDPASKEERGSIAPDIALAKEWYDKAAKAGNANVAQDSAALKAYVAEKAKAGDSTAQNLLKTWK